MKEPYGEGLAPHTDPESCVYSYEAMGEALTGAHAGQDIEQRNLSVSGCRRCQADGRQHQV